ncbi:YbaB/EbfC family nucleoid-associated protein [Roseiflexus sp. AH-315-K22]|nr:YbaB/EbfC family nucleoid-associated protein [Roseiflexus sp. AH-315-K22]
MLNQMKMMGALAGLMKNQDRIEASAMRTKETLAAARVTGEAGGGAVRVTFSGDMKAIAVELSPALAAGMGDEQSRQMAQDLVTDAINDGLKKAQELAKNVIADEIEALGLTDLLGSGGLGGAMPGLSGLLT